MNICGVVLSGGKSTRMGTNKALLQLNDKPVVQGIVEELKKCTKEVVLITNDNENVYDFLNVKQYKDRYIDKGPLAGIETALYNVNANIFAFAACDTPFINSKVYSELINQLDHYDAVVPIYNKQIHPLSAIYKKEVLIKVQEQLNNNNLRIRSFFNHINVKYVQEFNHIDDDVLYKHFFNMNNPQEYEQAKKI